MNTTTIKIDETQETQTQALAWLLEMERVTDPNFINAMILNVFKISRRIQDVQAILDSQNKRILIYLELDKWGQWFHTKTIQDSVLNMMVEALPSYEFRVTYDRTLLERAVKILQGEYNDERGKEAAEQDNSSDS